MDLQEVKKKIPALRNLSDADAFDVLHNRYYSDMDRSDLAARLNYNVQAEAPSSSRSWTQAATDTGRGLAAGVGGLVKTGGALYGLATGDMENGATELGDTVQKYWEEGQSQVLKDKKAARSAAIDKEDGMLAKAGRAMYETVTDPALAMDTVATNAATMIPGMGVGRLAAGAKYARGLNAVVQDGKILMPSALAAAEKAAASFGTKAAIGTGAVQQGADVSQQAYEQAMKKPNEVWAENPEFMAAFEQTDGSDAALQALKHEFALSAARATMPAATAISVGANMIPGADMLERALVGGAAREVGKGGFMSVAKSMGKGALGEAGQETLEEGGGQFVGNVANRRFVDPNQDLAEQVGENAGMGAAGGLLLGGAGGAFHGHAGETPEQAAAKAAAALAQQQADDALAARNNAVNTAHVAAATPNSPIARAAAASNPKVDPGIRLTELVNIPAQQGRALTEAEKLEYQTLKAEIDAAFAAQQAAAAPPAAPAAPAIDTTGMTPDQIAAALDAQAQDEQMHQAAVDIVKSTGSASIPQIAKNLRIGYNRAARMVEKMQQDGLVSPMAPDGSRIVLGAAPNIAAAPTNIPLETGAALSATPPVDPIDDTEIQRAANAERLAQDQAAAEADAREAAQDEASRLAYAPKPEDRIVNDGGYLYEGTQDGDIMNSAAQPFTVQHAAELQAKAMGAGHTVVPVFDGYVIRPPAKEANVSTANGVQPVPATSVPTDGDNAAAGVGSGLSDVSGVGTDTGTGTADSVDQSGEPASVNAQDAVATPLDAAAHGAATSPFNNLPQPTEGQKSAGNYAKGHVSINGLNIAIENPAGSERSGVDKAGNPWSNTLNHHYGYVKGTLGNDGDHVDLFIKPGTPLDYSGPVYVADQVDPDTGKFDEHKALVGFDSLEEAKAAYQSNYHDTWTGLRGVHEMPFDAFKSWAKDGKKKAPLGDISAPAAPEVSSEVSTTEPEAPEAPEIAPHKFPLPTAIKDDQATENLYKLTEARQRANERSGNTISEKPEDVGQKLHPEGAMQQLNNHLTSISSLNGKMLSGNKTSATTGQLLQAWVQANRLQNEIEASRKESPEMWDAYDQRQKDVLNLHKGDTVLDAYVSPENPTGQPGKIEKKFAKNWRISYPDGSTELRAPNTLRPGAKPVSQPTENVDGNQAPEAQQTETQREEAPAAKPDTSLLPRSESPAVNDYLDGKRDDAPTIEEVEAEEQPERDWAAATEAEQDAELNRLYAEHKKLHLLQQTQGYDSEERAATIRKMDTVDEKLTQLQRIIDKAEKSKEQADKEAEEARIAALPEEEAPPFEPKSDWRTTEFSAYQYAAHLGIDTWKMTTEQMVAAIDQKLEEKKKEQKKQVDEKLKATPRFASGLSAIGDLTKATFAVAGSQLKGIGIDVGELSKLTGIPTLANAILNLRAPVFIDSGAFGAFRRGLKSGEFTPMDFEAVFKKYDEILEAITMMNSREENDYPRPMMVMPDVIGDQAASLDLVAKYKDWVGTEVKGNLSKPIIPIHTGDLTMAQAYAKIVEVLGTDNFIVGIPSNAEAVSPADFEAFLKESKPKAVHILGAASDAKLRPRIESVVAAGLGDSLTVTADASPIRNAVIRGVAKGGDRKEIISNIMAAEKSDGEKISEGERPEGWEKSLAKARAIAEKLGIDTNKKTLPKLIEAIKLKDMMAARAAKAPPEKSTSWDQAGYVTSKMLATAIEATVEGTKFEYETQGVSFLTSMATDTTLQEQHAKGEKERKEKFGNTPEDQKWEKDRVEQREAKMEELARMANANFQVDLSSQGTGVLDAFRLNLRKYGMNPVRAELITRKYAAIGGSQARQANQLLGYLRTLWKNGAFGEAYGHIIEVTKAKSTFPRHYHHDGLNTHNYGRSDNLKALRSGKQLGVGPTLAADVLKDLGYDESDGRFKVIPDGTAYSLSPTKYGSDGKPIAAEETGANPQETEDIANAFNRAADGSIDGDFQMHHLFDQPAKSDIVRLGEKVKVYHKDHGWMTPEQAKAQIQQWKDHAKAQGKTNANSQKVVLSLFDLTGVWSQPWIDAGYNVYQFDLQDSSEEELKLSEENQKKGLTGGYDEDGEYDSDNANPNDVNSFSTQFFSDIFGDFEGMDVHAILAGVPCTDFASSGARHFAAKDADGRTHSSVELVHQTLRTIEYFKPAVWAVENPVGRIESLGGLPNWRLGFQPNDLGDPYTKKTLLWGRFNGDLPIAPVAPTEGSKMHDQYGGKSQATKNARSVTPEGFAYSFFMANNAVDNPLLAVAGKYDRLNRDLLDQALKLGITEEEISEVVDDPYYQHLDDEEGNQAIQDLIDAKTPKPEAEPEAAAAPRPANWQKNYGQAKVIAESLGVSLRGPDGKMFKLPGLVAQIKAFDATKVEEAQKEESTPSIPDANPVQSEPTPALSDEDANRVQAAKAKIEELDSKIDRLKQLLDCLA